MAEPSDGDEGGVEHTTMDRSRAVAGVAVGLGVGAAIGVAVDDLVIGLSTGIALGVVFVAAIGGSQQDGA